MVMKKEKDTNSWARLSGSPGHKQVSKTAHVCLGDCPSKCMHAHFSQMKRNLWHALPASFQLGISQLQLRLYKLEANKV